MSNRSTGTNLTSARGQAPQPPSNPQRGTTTINKNNNPNPQNNQKEKGDWKRYFTPERLKLFHTIVLILFLFLIMSYIFNTNSNVARVLVIISMCAALFCESVLIYSYHWS